MKRLLFLLISTLLIFSSCEKEEENSNNGSNNTSGSILGTWKVENFSHTGTQGYIDPIFGTEVVTNTTVNTGPEPYFDSYITFRYDNTLTEHSYHYDTLYMLTTWNYTKNENEIIINSGDVLTITQLTSNNFSFINTNPDNIYTVNNDTTFFQKDTVLVDMSKSNLPSITINPLTKKKSVSGYNSFLNRRENR